MNAKESCYLCPCILTDANRTRDHVPPRGVFADPLPNNLITVPCCKKCNHENHKADELFRSLMAMAYKRNEAGDQVWQKVVDRTMPSNRIREEIDKISASARMIADPFGETCVQYNVKQRPVKLQLIRITKGLLKVYNPEIDSSTLEWELTLIHQFRTRSALMTNVTNLLPYEVRGTGKEFQFWRGMAAERYGYGLWVYLFYNAVCFVVMHQSRTSSHRRHSGIRYNRRSDFRV